MNNWLGIVVGNSRSHWAWFQDGILRETWDTKHLSANVEYKELPSELLVRDLKRTDYNSFKIYLASVVPQQTKIWQTAFKITTVEIKDIPLFDIYPTMGIDRALAIYGGGEYYNYPCLVIDGGTALTFTGVDNNRCLVGGAILLGLSSHFKALQEKTAALPLVNLPSSLPSRWGKNTLSAISSGIINSTIAGIKSFIMDWVDRFPQSKIIITGGDAKLIYNYLVDESREIKDYLVTDNNLIFYGIQRIVISLNIKN